MSLEARIISIVVTYNPDPARVLKIVQNQSSCVAAHIVVDNGSEGHIRKALALGFADMPNVTLIEQGNDGIGAAQNLAIGIAAEMGASHVLFMDHDTDVGADIVAVLLAELLKLERAGAGVASIAPALSSFDVDSEDTGISVVPFNPSSGSLVPMSVLNAIGHLRGDYFIDHIDKEWGLRCAKRGLLSYRLNDFRVDHDLGDGETMVLGKVRRFHNNPVRGYYLVRNEILLWRDLEYSFGERFSAGIILAKWALVTLVAAPRPAERVKLMVAGVWDGFHNRRGISRTATPRA